ncbi:MAG: energy-coupling factor transporter transmembrane component T [Oscillospiraceae bacterium]|nr:energy-coupling factor transporter transmembrane component T [Oscillospiraceae bacterium]
MYIEKIQISKENRLEGMYPVAKLWVVLFYFATSVVLASMSAPFDGYSPLLYLWFFGVIVLAVLTGISKRFFKALPTVLTIFIIVVIVQAFIVETGDSLTPGVALWRWNISEGFHPTIWKYGLQNGLRLGFNILNGASIFVWLFQSTKNKELSRALEERGMNHKVVFVFLSSLEMIGVLGAKSKTIMNAQQARGVETQGNLLVRAKAFFPTMVPLVLGSITDTEERVLTMESKGFNAPCEKTHLLNLKKSGAEKPCVAVFIALFAIALIGRILMWVL